LMLDKTDSLNYPSFLPEEKDFWLNMSQRQFVKTRYSGLNPRGKWVESEQKRIEDLREIIETGMLTSPTRGEFKENSFLFDLSRLNNY